MIMDVIALGLFGGSWFWYIYGPAGKGREWNNELLDEDEDEYRTGCLYASFVLL